MEYKFLSKNCWQIFFSFVLGGIILLQMAFLVSSDILELYDNFDFGVKLIIFLGILQIGILFLIKNIWGNIISLLLLGFSLYISVIAFIEKIGIKFMYSAEVWVIFEVFCFLFSVRNLKIAIGKRKWAVSK
ncbi:hypothetical protein [Clostridium sp. ZS2-4]|uniref:hypothetical protein n=1 Tax=Clostridium sp. ZS2-4 TaxID=2987703 RepID=UPI00227C8AC2|nr:hypothetical protein [Clostridium sp. ZS2-4]MCY6356022.1 hypothetical protein [Clostridium sp. ZS2-4]